LRRTLERDLRTVLARSYVRIVGVNRELSWVVFDTLLPLLGVAAFVYVYKATVPDPDVANSLLVRVILGGSMVAFWMNILWGMGSTLYFEKEFGNLELFLMAPASRMAILLGMALGGMFNTTFRALATLLLGGVIFGVSFSLSSPPALLLVFLLTLIALYGMGMLFASLFLMYGREAWHTSNLLQEPIFLLSGFYFPVRFLGYYVGLLASVIPLTLGLDALNQLLGGTHAGRWRLLSLETEIALLAALSILFFLLARYALAYMEELGRRRGTLILKYQ
jgi:ABC-2 type transport system permease protein